MNNKNITFKINVKHLKSTLVKFNSVKNDKVLNNNLLLEIYNGEVYLIKQNQEFKLRQDINVEILDVEFNNLCVEIDYKLFTNFIKSLSVESIQINILNNKKLIVSYDDVEVIFNYDVIKGGVKSRRSPTRLFNLIYQDIQQIMNKVGFAVSTNNSRPILEGIHFSQFDNKLLVEATDSYRLSRLNINSVDVSDKCDFTIKASHIKQLLKIIPKNSMTEWSILYDELLIKWDGGCVTLTVIGGRYPCLDSLIRREYLYKCLLKKDDIIDILLQIRALDDIVCLIINEGSLIIENQDKDKCSYKRYVDNVIVKDNFKIVMKVDYLLDVLKYMNTSMFNVYISGKHQPVYIQPEDADEEIYIILPIKYY